MEIMGTVLRDTIFEENWIIRTVPMILNRPHDPVGTDYTDFTDSFYLQIILKAVKSV